MSQMEGTYQGIRRGKAYRFCLVAHPSIIIIIIIIIIRKFLASIFFLSKACVYTISSTTNFSHMSACACTFEHKNKQMQVLLLEKRMFEYLYVRYFLVLLL
jgi:hypothetical protein